MEEWFEGLNIRNGVSCVKCGNKIFMVVYIE